MGGMSQSSVCGFDLLAGSFWTNSQDRVPGSRWGRRDDRLWQCLETSESRVHHFLGTPSLETTQRLDRLLDRPHVLSNRPPLITGDALLLAIKREVDGDALIFWSAATRIRQT